MTCISRRKIDIKYQREIGDKVTTFGRNLEIIDREIRTQIKSKNGNQYNHNAKYYKYKCLNCGNEDWIYEYALGENMHCGCNACCSPPKKVVVGVNDITTTAKWMIKYFPNGIAEAERYTKYSNEIVNFVCPDCGKIHTRRIKDVCAAKSLSCICSDNISYPNKYMYYLLDQLKLNFQCEKSFSWSDNKRYDFYCEYANKTIIIEMNGAQHYIRSINDKSRTLDEEKSNDIYKENLAKNNGIDFYFSIDCKKSDSEYIKDSIIESGLLSVFHISDNEIDWNKIDESATSNFTKTICAYKNNHPDLALTDIADVFKIAPKTVLEKVKIGKKFGWCDYDINESRKIKESQQRIDHGSKPIYCITNGIYYRSSSDAEKALSTDKQNFFARQIRKSIQRGQNYLNHKFTYITREEFNAAKERYPDKTVGDKFVL